MDKIEEIAARLETNRADHLSAAHALADFQAHAKDDIAFLLAEVKRLEGERDAAYRVIRHMELCASDRMHALHRTVFESARKMGDE